MLTYELKKSPGVPLYEALYRCIRRDILAGTLKAGEKLPSKRTLAQNLEVSKITVEAAYNQLLEEGYIRSQEKVGYFVEQVEQPPVLQLSARPTQPIPQPELTGSEHFPFSVWSRLQREVMLDYGDCCPCPTRASRSCAAPLPDIWQLFGAWRWIRETSSSVRERTSSIIC